MSASSTAGANGSSYLAAFPNAQPRPLVVAGGDEPCHMQAALGDGDGFTVVVHPIDEREALGLELGGGNGLHVTSLNDQSDGVNRDP